MVGAYTLAPTCSKETPSMLADFEDVLDRLSVASRNGEKAMCFAQLMVPMITLASVSRPRTADYYFIASPVASRKISSLP